jgi:hypothetical protein
MRQAAPAASVVPAVSAAAPAVSAVPAVVPAVPAASAVVPAASAAPAVPAVVPAAAPSAAGRRQAGWPTAALCVLAAAGLALFGVPLHRVRLSQMNGLGLISVLPAASLAGVGLLVLAFVLMLGLRRPRPVVLGAMLIAIVVCLDGVAALAEAEPRFATAYQIAGFVDYISRTGHTAPAMDAYFNWPGFFLLVAFVERVVGQHDLIGVMRWWPLAIDLLCLVPFALIMRNLRISWRAKWLAAFLFAVGNWVGQDYFSPQSANYLLYLIFIAILLTWFRGRVAGRPATARRGTGRRAGRVGRHGRPAAERGTGVAGRLGWRAFGRLTPGELPPRQASGGERIIMALLLVAIFVSSTVSHQLTPFLMLGACGGLVLARRCTLTGLPVLLGVILIGWISFGTVAYWSGHLSDIVGGIGHLGANVSASVGGRISGTSQLHHLVLDSRVAFAAAVMALAALGLWRRRRAGISDRALLVLLCVPFLAVGLQNYGGEIALRVYLFALPAASVLAACLFFPGVRPGKSSWRALTAAAVLAACFAGLFFVARYGNEAFEQTPSGELAAMDYVYAHDGSGAQVAWLSAAPSVNATPEMPWAFRDIGRVSYVAVQAPRNPASVAELAASLRRMGPGSYLVATATQVAYLQQEAGYPLGWGGTFRSSMAAVPGVRVVFASSTAAVYTLRWPPGTPRAQEPASRSAAAARSTAWTPAGLVILGLLVATLLAAELLRAGMPGSRRLARALTMSSVPLVVLLLAVVIERFAVLS